MILGIILTTIGTAVVYNAIEESNKNADYKAMIDKRDREYKADAPYRREWESKKILDRAIKDKEEAIARIEVYKQNRVNALKRNSNLLGYKNLPPIDTSKEDAIIAKPLPELYIYKPEVKEDSPVFAIAGIGLVLAISLAIKSVIGG